MTTPPSSTLVFLDAGTIGRDIEWPDFSEFGEVIFYDQTAPITVAERLRQANMVFTNKVGITAEHIAAAPKLAYIGTIATGYNQVDGVAAAARGIPLCNVPNYSTYSVVQHVFSLLLALYSDICPLSHAVRKGEWSKNVYFSFWLRPVYELANKVMGVVGFGAIGSHVARVANSLGMQVIAHTPHPKPVPEFAPFAFVDLPTLFREADVISLHCPLTPQNIGMINLAVLRGMKKNAVLINTARGPLVHDADLAKALEQGYIAGAGLDVVNEEPMPNENPLRSAPNCIITPHTAWATVEARTRLMKGVYANVRNFVAGMPTNVQNGL